MGILLKENTFNIMNKIFYIILIKQDNREEYDFWRKWAGSPYWTKKAGRVHNFFRYSTANKPKKNIQGVICFYLSVTLFSGVNVSTIYKI